VRRNGVSAFIIECAALYRCHQKRMEFDALGLPDELSSLDITSIAASSARSAARER
jgi:hypothetical protein